MTKICTKCHADKELGEFPICEGNPNWRMGICKDCKRVRDNEYSRRRNERDREKVNARNAVWAAENREQDLERKRKYNREHCDELHRWHQKNYQENKIAILAYGKEHVKFRRRTDLNFRLTCILRSRVRNALAGHSKSARTMEMLGCSIEELKAYLQSKFKRGMRWENYGKFGWHVDHIIPCASFDMSSPQEQRRCFHFSNLQPLWADENMRKGARISKAA